MGGGLEQYRIMETSPLLTCETMSPLTAKLPATLIDELLFTDDFYFVGNVKRIVQTFIFKFMF